MKKAAIITIIILLIIAGAVAWILYKKKVGTSASSGNDSGSGTDTGSKTSTELSKNESLMPLKRGSGFGNSEQEQLVTDLQKGLNKNFGGNIAIDGDFGGQTQSALMSRGLPVEIYWREWSFITKKPIYVGGQQVTITSI